MTICKNNTSITEQDGIVHVILHKTIIATMDRETGVVNLYTGGWNTPTTRRRINQCLESWGKWQRVYKSSFANTNHLVIE